ncbi:hypothetical protein NEMBOFW57_009401 [Staphylotrichum longicolle]|uniref:Aminoglycoside phosphotransferase domain-containing protein n=1 Tax=Staphylotrichum longicolle TaxID=669026 RepID=A0AAD4EP17_9PEZI|nr:hypothetical protein NEMBOFW57_009401 [Staphylotrichum longicolle]
MAVLGYKEKEGESLTTFYNLITTKSVQLKQSVKPWMKTHNGELASRLYNKERILNYAAALQLISKRTTIPVPKLIDFGENDDGTAWIETERTHGGVWLDVVRDQCRMPPGKKHVDDGNECDECDRIARANARRFITQEVIPQLNSLTSDTTGLDGLVIPPLWVMFHDKTAFWPPKRSTSGQQEYVFCHGNLHGHSMLMHAETLHVLKIVDWEDAGYFPPEFQVWSVERKDYEALYEDEEQRKRLTELML